MSMYKHHICHFPYSNKHVTEKGSKSVSKVRFTKYFYWCFTELQCHSSQRHSKMNKKYTANISVVKSTTRTLCLFPSGTTDAVSTTDRSMLRIVVLRKYNKYVINLL